MGISITTDVHCDLCSRWAHYHCGSAPAPARDVFRDAEADGWSVKRTTKEFTCPACNGAKPDYFRSISGAPPSIRRKRVCAEPPAHPRTLQA